MQNVLVHNHRCTIITAGRNHRQRSPPPFNLPPRETNGPRELTDHGNAEPPSTITAANQFTATGNKRATITDRQPERSTNVNDHSRQSIYRHGKTDRPLQRSGMRSPHGNALNRTTSRAVIQLIEAQPKQHTEQGLPLR